VSHALCPRFNSRHEDRDIGTLIQGLQRTIRKNACGNDFQTQAPECARPSFEFFVAGRSERLIQLNQRLV
jgi:hypothetical protein